ncbi:MAG: glycoside hydrolase family 97 protein [Bacteroidales bacterium]|nr:glycoside hydrolase family 97 protein [Bacteroidales bacterium]
MTIQSPSGDCQARFWKEGKVLRYEVKYKKQEAVLPSRAGLQLDNWAWEMALGKRDLEQPDCWMDLLQVDSVTVNPAVDETWQPLYGERSTVMNCYNSATLHLSRHDNSDYRLDVEVRAYNQGVAFRYFFPEHPAAIFHKVTQDLTDYSLPHGTMAWSQRWAQATHDYTPIDSITVPVERPLTMQLPSGAWVALLDADVDDWCLTKFVADSEAPSTLHSVMYSPVDLVTYCATPWRVIMLADSPGQLLENNDIVLNLNPRCEIEDTSWIKPGKIMRCTQLTTEAGKEVIDFCAKNNFQYMLYDWKWYEPCTSHDGDATQVIDAIDMPEVAQYGREHGVGVWLYVNQHALMKQQRQLFPLLRDWGIVGVKSGFVQYASHRWATWLHDMVRLAADNQLMMNIHDEFRPSGFSRTYPNLLTQEGICGNEEWPDADHDCTLPFTRMLCGAADYTICYYDPRLKNTHGHQLAASLVYYSPLLTVLWYDTPSRCHGEPEMEWFAELPTVWDDTRVLSGYPGQPVVMARRKGDDWWLAAMGNNQASLQTVNLGFLSPDKEYCVTLYSDDENASTATKISLSERTVTSDDTLTLPLQPRGGAAAKIRMKSEK